MMERELVYIGFGYKLRRNLSLQFDVANLTNAPQRFYRGISEHLSTLHRAGTTIFARSDGRFCGEGEP